MKNLDIKITGAGEGFYHVFFRGADGRRTFADDEEYNKIIDIVQKNVLAVENGSFKVLAFCFMTNNAHFVVQTDSAQTVERALKKTIMDYEAYILERYGRPSVDGSSYSIAHIGSRDFLKSISRCVHLTPDDLDLDIWSYPYSSLQYYLGKAAPDWLSVDTVLAGETAQQYREFVKANQDLRLHRLWLADLLADRLPRDTNLSTSGVLIG